MTLHKHVTCNNANRKETGERDDGKSLYSLCINAHFDIFFKSSRYFIKPLCPSSSLTPILNFSSNRSTNPIPPSLSFSFSFFDNRGGISGTNNLGLLNADIILPDTPCLGLSRLGKGDKSTGTE